jgi:hypothetical protein
MRRCCIGVVAALIGGPACTDRAETEPPPHRIEPCEDWCTAVVDPECGSPDAEMFDHDDCVDHCASEGDWNWAPQPNGEDQCAPEQIAYIECVVGLECSERAQHFRENSGVIDEGIPCYEEMQAMFECVADAR